MAQKTYYQLKYEDRHLEVDDALLIHGVNYTVCHAEFTDAYFLNNAGGPNCKVFTDVFGLTEDEKYIWAKKFNSTGSGSFPEFKDIRDLERFVIDIYEKPEYNVGDYVTILERAHDGNDYPASFTNSMTDYCGKTFVIERVNSVRWNIEEVKLCGGEPHLYVLEGVCFSWHPSMFRKATEEEIRIYKGITKSLEAEEFTEEEFKIITSSDLQDSELRLPKNINKTPHINL